MLGIFLATTLLFASEASVMTDSEAWNNGVNYYLSGDITNAVNTLEPLLLSRTHKSRVAEVLAKIEYERGNLIEAAKLAQIALRADPDDPKANRNFSRATANLPEKIENDRINSILKASQGKDAGDIMRGGVYEARKLFEESGTYRTNEATKAVVLSDSLSQRAYRLADLWIPVREAITEAVTNDEQAATILTQIQQAQERTKKAAKELSDFNGDAYGTLSNVEEDFTSFFKLIAQPPSALSEDLIAQSNALLKVAAINNRAWQKEAIDYTRNFRMKFPVFAHNYEQQAQSDTNMVPFTAEAQNEISALSTQLEKLQMECIEKPDNVKQTEAIALIQKIQELMPKNKNSGGQGKASGSPQNKNEQSNDQEPSQSEQDENESNESQTADQEQGQSEEEQDEKSANEADDEEADQDEVEALLRKAQERNDEHEADVKARMRKAPLPPNERDW